MENCQEVQTHYRVATTANKKSLGDKLVKRKLLANGAPGWPGLAAYLNQQWAQTVHGAADMCDNKQTAAMESARQLDSLIVSIRKMWRAHGGDEEANWFVGPAGGFPRHEQGGTQL
jgi:hypothetical protein